MVRQQSGNSDTNDPGSGDVHVESIGRDLADRALSSSSTSVRNQRIPLII